MISRLKKKMIRCLLFSNSSGRSSCRLISKRVARVEKLFSLAPRCSLAIGRHHFLRRANFNRRRTRPSERNGTRPILRSGRIVLRLDHYWIIEPDSAQHHYYYYSPPPPTSLPYVPSLAATQKSPVPPLHTKDDHRQITIPHSATTNVSIPCSTQKTAACRHRTRCFCHCLRSLCRYCLRLRQIHQGIPAARSSRNSLQQLLQTRPHPRARRARLSRRHGA